MPLKYSILALLAVAFLLHGAAHACQYNVRDVGFVELSSDPYRLYLVLPDETPEAQRDLIDSVATVALIDTNVEFELRSPASAKGIEGLASLTLSQPSDLPWAALVSPDGRAFPVALAPALSAPDVEAALQGVFERLVSSPMRAALRDETVDKFGVVFLLEGADAAANQRASEAIQDALTRLHTRMKMLPKPIAKPPVLMTLSPEKAAAEPVLLWSLGLDSAPVEPTAVLLYSRVRRMGPNIVGDEITAKRVEDYLGVVGSDCECGLDRKWMQGSMLPIRWESTLRERLATGLGFDPEDPMVKTEISILVSKSAKGGAPGARGLSAGSGTQLGYTEMSDQEAAQAEGEDAAEAASALPPAVTVMAETQTPPVDTSITPGQSQATPAALPADAATQAVEARETRTAVALLPLVGGLLLCSLVVSALILWRARATQGR